MRNEYRFEGERKWRPAAQLETFNKLSRCERHDLGQLWDEWRRGDGVERNPLLIGCRR